MDDRCFKDDDFKEYADQYAELRAKGFDSFSIYNDAVSDAIDKILTIFEPAEYEEPAIPVLTEEEYTKMCAESDNLNVYDGRGNYDQYECEDCRHHVFTTYAEKGVTPFIIKCPECGGAMKHNATYGSISSEIKVLKWLRPTYKQYLNLSPYTRQHIEDGGLILETMLEE